MNRDRFEGGWKQFSGKVKEHWCKLADDQPGVIASTRDPLAGRIHEQYGISKEKSEYPQNARWHWDRVKDDRL